MALDLPRLLPPQCSSSSAKLLHRLAYASEPTSDGWASYSDVDVEVEGPVSAYSVGVLRDEEMLRRRVETEREEIED
jgi:hypothetical protein